MKKGSIFSYLVMALSLLIGCSGNSENLRITKNKKTNLDKTEGSAGNIDQKMLSSADHDRWFIPKYSAYKTKTEYFDLAKTQFQINDIKQYDIEIFLGTWCRDSQREVPRFLKILNELDYPQEKLKMFTMNKINGKLENKRPNEIAKNIRKVPTFIFYESSREMGRIVESPGPSGLEGDIIWILAGQKPYVKSSE